MDIAVISTMVEKVVLTDIVQIIMTDENTNFRSKVVIHREGPYFLTDLILETAGQSFMGPAELFLRSSRWLRSLC